MALVKGKIFKSLVIIFFSFFISLSILEAALQMTPLGEPKKTTVLVKKSDNSVLSYELKKDFKRKFKNPDGYEIDYYVNQDGYRGPLKQNSEGSNILIIGDSVTFGFGVKDHKTYAQTLEEILNENQEKKIKTINLGVGGYNTEQELQVYEKRHNEFKPEVVILGFSLNDASPDGDWIWDNTLGHIRQKNLQTVSTAYKGPLNGKFPFGRLLDKSRIYNLTIRPILFKDATSATQKTPSDQKEYDLYIENYFNVNSVDSWEQRKSYILRLKELTSNNGQKFLLLIFPLAYQVEFETEKNPQQKVVEFAVEHNIEYIDFLQDFRDEKRDVSTLFIDNSHPTEVGHALIGKIAGRYITQNHWYKKNTESVQ